MNMYVSIYASSCGFGHMSPPLALPVFQQLSEYNLLQNRSSWSEMKLLQYVSLFSFCDPNACCSSIASSSHVTSSTPSVCRISITSQQLSLIHISEPTRRT